MERSEPNEKVSKTLLVSGVLGWFLWCSGWLPFLHLVRFLIETFVFPLARLIRFAFRCIFRFKSD